VAAKKTTKSKKNSRKTFKSMFDTREKVISLIKATAFTIFMLIFVSYIGMLTSNAQVEGELMSPSNPSAIVFIFSLVLTVALLVTLIVTKQKPIKSIETSIKKKEKTYEKEIDISKELKLISRELRRL